MAEPSIHIRHLEANYKVPSGMRDPSLLQRRFDSIASEALARIWSERLAQMASDDETIYFVERVEVDLTLNPSSSDDRGIADIWARSLQEGIVRTIARREGGVVIFRNRAELVATFLQDLLHGDAWEHWYYDEFRDLASRSFGDIAATLLCDDADTGRDALLELTKRGELESLLASLDEPDAEVIVERTLLPPGPPARFAGSYRHWMEAIRSLMPLRRSTRPRDLARLYLGLIDRHPELGPDVNLARFIDRLLRLAGAIQESGNDALLGSIDRDAYDDAARRLPSRDDRDALLDLLRTLPGSEVTAVLRDMGGAETITSRFHTRFGGLFLLAPAAAEMGLHQRLARVRADADAGLLLYLIALQSIGAENAKGKLSDRALALFAGIDRAPTHEELASFQAGLSDEEHAALARGAAALHEALPAHLDVTIDSLDPFMLSNDEDAIISDRVLDAALAPFSALLLARFAATLGAFSGSSPGYLRRNFIESRAEIEVSEGTIDVRFITSPLQMVLRMAGFEGSTAPIAWLGPRRVSFRYE